MSDPIAQPESNDPEIQLGPQVRLDWKAYFNQFSELHGRNPIKHRGRLLFPDGWSYSSTSYGGPEWPPPADPVERVKLELVYWSRRKSVVEAECTALREVVTSLKGLQHTKSAAIQHRITLRDEETGKVSSKAITFNQDDFQKRLQWLQQDVEECNERIQTIQADLDSVATQRTTPTSTTDAAG